MIEVNRKDVEAVKLAMKAVMRQGIPVNETMVGTIDFLYDCYRWSEDRRYLLGALTSLQAYLELGYKYEDYREKFDQLMKDLGTYRELQFGGLHFPLAVIPLSKTKIKSVIGTWNASKYHTMPVADMLEDIIRKVKNKEVGRYEYHSNYQPDSRKPDRVFELLVGEDASYFYDVQRDQYYMFV